MDQRVQATSLLEIREFLSTHHCVPAPWESPKDVAEHLYGALCAKREDQKFWFELQDLVNRLDDLRFDRAAFDGADAFRGTTLSHLMTDLRNSLDGGSRGGGIRRWASRSLCVAALFSFLLLGVAAGCSNDSGDDDDNDDSAAMPADDDTAYLFDSCPQADAEGILGYDGEVFCVLIDIINAADLPAATKNDLLECLPQLDADYRADLLEVFQTLTDEQIADYLSNPTVFCENPSTGDDDDDDDDDNDDDDH